MTRDEFLGRLGELLACLPAEQVEETKASMRRPSLTAWRTV